MVWVKLDDRFAENHKVLRCSVGARWLHVEAMCFAGRNETGGFVPAAFAEIRPAGFRAELEAAGLWEKSDGGWKIHDWDQFNPSAGQLAEKRERDRIRKASARNPDGIQADPPRARVPSPAPTPSPAPEPEPDPEKGVPGTERLSPPKRRRARPAPSPQAIGVAEALRDAILAHTPDHECARNGCVEKWARDADLALRRDKRTPEQLRAAIAFAHGREEETFWRPNIQSGKKLREKFETLRAQARRTVRAADARPEVIAARDAWLEDPSCGRS